MRSKTEIRCDTAAILRLPPDLRAEKSARLCEAVTASAAWQTARMIAIFAPQPREPDVEMLWSRAAGKSFTYPRVEDGRLDLFREDSLYELAPGAFGVREPAADPAHAGHEDEIERIGRDGVRGIGGGFADSEGSGRKFVQGIHAIQIEPTFFDARIGE